jgi:hypothetical protein
MNLAELYGLRFVQVAGRLQNDEERLAVTL